MTVHRMHALRPWREESFKRRLNRINLNIFTVIMISFFGLLFMLCFAFAAIVNFYGAASVARPAVADEPTTTLCHFMSIV